MFGEDAVSCSGCAVLVALHMGMAYCAFLQDVRIGLAHGGTRCSRRCVRCGCVNRFGVGGFVLRKMVVRMDDPESSVG